MATIKVTITVGKLTNVLTLFDEIKVYRSVTGEAGPYVEITGPGTRIALAAGQTVYVYDDTAGDPAYWYKTSYYNSVSTLESSLSEAIRGDASTLYVDVDDIRGEGVLVSVADDDRVLELISTWQQFIERETRNWFRPRELDWYLDGNGTTLLQLPVPIISVSGLYVNDDFVTPLETDAYRVYNGRGEEGRDDRRNPRIKLATGDTSIFAGTGPVRRDSITTFEVGEKNQRVVGSFGYVEPDGSVPGPIRYALKKLVVRSARPLAGSGGGGAGPAGPVIEEETDRHRKRWADPFVSSKAWSVSGDPEVDQILAAYRAPLAMRAPRTLYRRMTGGTVL
jgi:hypothetical protein